MCMTVADALTLITKILKRPNFHVEVLKLKIKLRSRPHV